MDSFSNISGPSTNIKLFLPPPLIAKICSHLEITELAQSLPIVSQYFYKTTSENSIWKERFLKDFTPAMHEAFQGELPEKSKYKTVFLIKKSISKLFELYRELKTNLPIVDIKNCHYHAYKRFDDDFNGGAPPVINAF